ncbi:MAG: hypothetical protein K0Q73_6490 [Paenibacillus sp.]|nr:hypothetical protein [Paenibacillus sp.]
MSLVKTCIVTTKKCVTGVKGNFKKRKIKKPSKSIIQRIKELGLRVTKLRSFVLHKIKDIVIAINKLNTQVNNLQAQVLAPILAIRNLLQSRMGTAVTIQTAVGSISGTVVSVGRDFVQLLEPSGAIVFIPISKINTIS